MPDIDDSVDPAQNQELTDMLTGQQEVSVHPQHTITITMALKATLSPALTLPQLIIMTLTPTDMLTG